MFFARGWLPFALIPLGIALLIVAILFLTDLLFTPLVLILLIPILFIGFIKWFFRDPERTIGEDIVAPADGVVQSIDQIGPNTRIAIFMNPFNVHVNRFPMDCTVTGKKYHEGGYLPAYNKESEQNERLHTYIKTAIGKVELVQISGALVRRIDPYYEMGMEYPKGTRMGMIRFGSRVDTYLPSKKVSTAVQVSDKTKAGITTIATIGKKRK